MCSYYPINMYMIFGILTLLTALAIAGVAAWFSIVGLMLLFSGSAMEIAIMAGTLEVGKLLTASWLYRYWNETSKWLRGYLTVAVVILMVITSVGIFGYLSKAAGDQASNGGDALAVVERVDSQIAREENKISLLEERIAGVGGNIDVTDSLEQQAEIRDGAWVRVQGDIDYNQEQIENVRDQLKVDIASQDARLTALDVAVNELRAKGIETITLDEGGLFQSADIEKIDYVEQANDLRQSQQVERDEIKAEKDRIRNQATGDIKVFQDAIDRYRGQAQLDINEANNEINRLRSQTTSQQDNNLIKIDELNIQIDNIYESIVNLKDEKFDAESKVRDLEREVGPIKYLSQLVIGSDDADSLETAIRWFILMLVFVFDPLAVVLVIAANQTLLRYGINLESTGPEEPTPPTDDDDNEQWYEPEFEEQNHKIYGDNMPDLDDDSLANIVYDNKDDDAPVDSTPYEHRMPVQEYVPSAVDDAADIMSDYDGKDKTFFESINEPATPQVQNVDQQKTVDIVEQIAKTDSSAQNLNMILKGKTKSQLLLMAEDGGLEIPAQLGKAEIVANIIANYDIITKKKI